MTTPPAACLVNGVDPYPNLPRCGDGQADQCTSSCFPVTQWTHTDTSQNTAAFFWPGYGTNAQAKVAGIVYTYGRPVVGSFGTVQYTSVAFIYAGAANGVNTLHKIVELQPSEVGYFQAAQRANMDAVVAQSPGLESWWGGTGGISGPLAGGGVGGPRGWPVELISNGRSILANQRNLLGSFRTTRNAMP
ncbi:MAG: hypothetical protein QM831_20655 [Kofleriaceae bacterium]